MEGRETDANHNFADIDFPLWYMSGAATVFHIGIGPTPRAIQSM